jgi:hypothetical protein
MIDIAALVALRDGVATAADDGLQHAASAAPEQDTTAPLAPASSTYPAKKLVLKDGRYHVDDHAK